MAAILTSHYGGFQPTRPLLRGEGLQLGFVGKPTTGDIPNPGSPAHSGDPDYLKKLVRLFGDDRTVFYLANGHTGEINYIGEQCPNSPRWQFCNPRVFRIANVAVLQGDAIVVHYGTLPAELRHITVVSKTWDCGNLLLLNKRERVFAVVHASIRTIFNYGDALKDSPMIGEVLSQCGDQQNITVACGPCISGLASGRCWCYEFDTADAGRLFASIKRYYPALLQTGLRRERPDAGKTDIAFGELLVRVLEYFGLRRHQQIDLSCNFCTMHELGYYSNRAIRKQLQRTDLSPPERAELEQQMQAKYGNLAFVHLT